MEKSQRYQKITKISFFSLFILLILFGCTQKEISSKVKVLEVIDGDTVVLENGKTLRYIGIDAPEVRRYIGGEWVYDPQPFSLEAKEFNKNLVEGKYIKIEFDVQKKDKYGRLLGYCFIDSIFINAKLLEEGLAFLYTRPPNVKYVDLFVSSQKKAREDKKGIWKDQAIISSDEAYKYIGQIKTVEGKVLNIHEGEKVIIIIFGKDLNKDFTVVIFKIELSNFTNQGTHPSKDYRNKFIRVTGLIKEYNGPEIIVSHPSSIEVIE